MTDIDTNQDGDEADMQPQGKNAARNAVIRNCWFSGMRADEIGQKLSPQLSAGQIYVIAKRISLPRRIKTQRSEWLIPILRAPQHVAG